MSVGVPKVYVRQNSFKVLVKFPGPQGPPGAASLGGDLYVHPTSNKAYLYVAETAKYHRITGVMVDGIVSMGLDSNGISTPV